MGGRSGRGVSKRSLPRGLPKKLRHPKLSVHTLSVPRLQTDRRQLEETSATVPELLEVTQDKLQGLLKSAQSLSIERYALADKLANLFSQLDSSAAESSETESPQQGKTVLEKMEALSQELARLETGLVWVELLEKVVLLR